MKFPKQNSEVSSRKIESETIIVDLNGQRLFHKLNETAGRIWELCDGRNDVETIVNLITDEFDTDIEKAQKDTKALLGQFQDINLITYVES